MKEEAISSSGDPFLPPRSCSPPPSLTPAARLIGQGQNSKGGPFSHGVAAHVRASLSTSAGGSALGSSQPSCRPWERGDLLRRLSTFKPANWFGKPKAASSLACARKGWVNVDVDKVECESCGAILEFVSSATWTPSEGESCL
ncbi:hypothetical protein DH2020_033818 [Rehmannia glutinosa]|uniref:C3HC-type domain-containing protein n=1 Tax=Rehmannia glutinosa TaxID=99300 RepID=A0ABR0VBI3_REHGL